MKYSWLAARPNQVTTATLVQDSPAAAAAEQAPPEIQFVSWNYCPQHVLTVKAAIY